MTKKIEFSPEQRDQIKLAMRDHLHIADETVQDAFVNSIEETGVLRAFGFGSLLSYSHLQEPDGKFKDDLTALFPGIDAKDVVKTSPAALEGYNRDFVCFDIVYRGTPQKPGITLGLDKAESGKTSGGILETRIDNLNPNIAANFIQHYLKRFEEREYPASMPIYTFGFLNVATPDGKSVPSLVCIADPNGPLYIHNPENRFAKTDPFYAIGRDEDGYKRKVEIMATAMNAFKPDGSAKPKGAMTDLDYLRNLINDSMAKGITVEARFHRLFADAVFHRIKMGPEFRAHMQGFERGGAAANAPDLLNDFMGAIQLHNHKLAAANTAAPASESLPPAQ